MKLIQCILLSIILPFSAAAQDRFRVTFINPGFADVTNPTGGFWLSVSAFMIAAAEDLNIDLEIIYSNRDHMKMQNDALEVVARQNPPDFLIVVNEKLSAENIVKEADKRGVKVFVMLNRFEGDQRITMGQPREKYNHWIGTLVPDNRYAGYQIAKILIDHAREAGVNATDGHLHLAGFSGDYVTQAAIERAEGLKQAVAEYADVDLKQIIACNWSKEDAMVKTPLMLKRYPHLGAIWAANDPIALGAIDGAIASGRKPGKDIFFGGLNWDPPALEKIKDGEMVTSLGGHFMTGGWVLVLLYDYYHGKDFADEGVQLQYKIFGAIDAQNINVFLKKFGDRNWGKLDFKEFSKVLNPTLPTYRFNCDALLTAR